MKEYSVKIIHKLEVAQNTLACILEKPEGFSYTAGQFIELAVPGVTEKHAFSLTSEPSEAHLSIVTRMRQTPFKVALGKLQNSDTLTMSDPYGRFTLPMLDIDTPPLVFLASGIGITPFFSMIKHADKQELPYELTLFYGDRTIERMAFLSELEWLCYKNHFTFIPFSPFLPQLKFFIQKYKKSPLFYLCGSPSNVDSDKEMLHQIGVPREQVKVEEFDAY